MQFKGLSRVFSNTTKKNKCHYVPRIIELQDEFETYTIDLRLLVDSVVNNLPANAGDAGSVPGSGRSPGGGNGNPFQDLCLENPMDREAWRATVHGGHKESDTTEAT